MSIPKINWQAIARLKREDGTPLISLPTPMPFIAPEPDYMAIMEKPRTPKRRMRRIRERRLDPEQQTPSNPAA